MLVPELAQLDGVSRVRLSYLQPAEIRPALLDAMADQIRQLQAGDLGALVNYYSSYRSAD